MTSFPVAETQQSVKTHCFNCGQPTENHRRSGYAIGRGAWRGDCAKCGMSKWFDLRAEMPLQAAP